MKKWNPIQLPVLSLLLFPAFLQRANGNSSHYWPLFLPANHSGSIWTFSKPAIQNSSDFLWQLKWVSLIPFFFSHAFLNLYIPSLKVITLYLIWLNAYATLVIYMKCHSQGYTTITTSLHIEQDLVVLRTHFLKCKSLLVQKGSCTTIGQDGRSHFHIIPPDLSLISSFLSVKYFVDAEKVHQKVMGLTSPKHKTSAVTHPNIRSLAGSDICVVHKNQTHTQPSDCSCIV